MTLTGAMAWPGPWPTATIAALACSVPNKSDHDE
jgi:hypothetical protein